MEALETQKKTEHEFDLLEEIEFNPDVTQASLSVRLGLSVGMINWYIKRLIAKGYVKVKRAQRRKLRYIITPEGLAFRARLTINYLESSMQLYRKTRQRVRELLGQVKQRGFDRVCIEGDGDIADICRLTCLEQGIAIVEQAPCVASGESQEPELLFRSGSLPASSMTAPGMILLAIPQLPVLEARGTKVILKV